METSQSYRGNIRIDHRRNPCLRLSQETKNSFTLTRFYGPPPKLNLKWTFNDEGRLVKAELERQYRTLERALLLQEIQKGYLQIKSQMSRPNLAFYGPELIFKSPSDVSIDLVKKGFHYTNLLDNCLKSGKYLTAQDLAPYERPLSDLRKRPDLLQLIEISSKQVPREIKLGDELETFLKLDYPIR